MAIVAKPLEVGELVRWTSAGGGVWRHHVGVIVGVVPAGALPRDHLPAGRWALHFRDNAARREASFLVALKDGSSRGAAGQLHRPRVYQLRRFEEGSDPVIEIRRRRAPRARPGLPVPVAAPSPARLASGATLRPRADCRALVVYRRHWSMRERITAAIAAPVFVALLALLVVGLGRWPA